MPLSAITAAHTGEDRLSQHELAYGTNEAIPFDPPGTITFTELELRAIFAQLWRENGSWPPEHNSAIRKVADALDKDFGKGLTKG